MYNMHGHPWSRILNPQNKKKKESKLKSFFEKIKNIILSKSDNECSEVFLRQFWDSIDLQVKTNTESDVSLIV